MALVLDTPESCAVTRKEAFSSSLIPESTATYQAVPNEHLVNMLYEVAKKHGVELTNERLGIDLKGQRLFGVVDVVGKDFYSKQVQLMLGFCNSYNKSMRIRVCVGGKVFVCSNRAFHAWTDEETGISSQVGHRHTVNVNDGLWQRLDASLSQIDAYRRSQINFYERLQNTRLTQDKAYATIVRAAQADVIKKTRALNVAQEWDRQSRAPESEEEMSRWHPEFKKRNAFSLFNAFTEVEKERADNNLVVSNLKTVDLSNFFFDQFVLHN